MTENSRDRLDRLSATLRGASATLRGASWAGVPHRMAEAAALGKAAAAAREPAPAQRPAARHYTVAQLREDLAQLPGEDPVVNESCQFCVGAELSVFTGEDGCERDAVTLVFAYGS